MGELVVALNGRAAVLIGDPGLRGSQGARRDALWEWSAREDRTSEAPPIRDGAGFLRSQMAADI